MYSLPWCITWSVVLLTLSVAIVALNIMTIIVSLKTRDLHKRSMCLLRNLAVADMLVGAFTMPDHFIVLGVACNILKDILSESLLSSQVIFAVRILFPVCSLLNITVISVERFHATFWPFRHRVVKTWAYGLLIACIWVTSVMLSAGVAVIEHLKKSRQIYFYLWGSFDSTCLLVICACYASILFKVRCGSQPRPHGAASRERRLTMTLLIVTVVSLLLWLPFPVSSFLYYTTDIFSSLSIVTVKQVNTAMIVLFYANSLINPIIYVYRIPELRKALVALFRKPHQQLNQPAAIPLCDL